MDRIVGRLHAKIARRDWPIAAAPGRMVALFLVVEILAIVLISLAWASVRTTVHDAWLASLLTLMALAFEEGVSRAARLEMRLSADLKRDMTSVWTVSSAVVLPAAYAVAVVAVVSGYVWIRQHRLAGRPLYRGVYNISTWLIGTLCASLAVHSLSSTWDGLPWALGGTISVLVAMFVYTAVNRFLISAALLIGGVPLRQLRGSRNDNLIELATLCLGGLVAIAGLHEPLLCILVLAPMVTLQRGALVHELEAAARIDAKTGMLNAIAWEQLAKRELEHAHRDGKPLSVLIIDIDRFKLVNDNYGHLVGDEVLAAVGRCLSDEVREFDTVGRFGGEEFVVVLPSANEADALVVAERLRSKINDLRISTLIDAVAADPDDHLAVSIGVSCAPGHGEELPDLLVAADSALYRAKAGGRNRVVLADPGQGNPFERVFRG